MVKYFYLDERDDIWYECQESEALRFDTLGYIVKKVVYPNKKKEERWWEQAAEN